MADAGQGFSQMAEREDLILVALIPCHSSHATSLTIAIRVAAMRGTVWGLVECEVAAVQW